MTFKKTTIYIVMALLCLFYKVHAQSNQAIDIVSTGLQIGQKVPDLTITNLHNYKDKYGKPSSTAKLSDFEGKLLIIDFWATWCSPCLAMIPKMDSLQTEFGDKIQFLSVTYQSEKEVLPFLEKFEKQRGKNFDLPLVTDEIKLHKLFPHVYLPHYVWIDREGKINAFTDEKEVTESNINKVLNNEIKLSLKFDSKLEYDLKKPLFYNYDDTFAPHILKQSTISNYINGLPSGVYQNINLISQDKYKRITVTNRNIPLLFQVAYGEGKTYFGWNRMELNVRDKEKLFIDRSGKEYRDWMEKGNAFCYELIVPSQNSASAWGIMKEDLSKAFPQYTVKVEKRTTSILQLIRTSDIDKIKTLGGEREIDINVNGVKIQNLNLSFLIKELNYKGVGVERPLENATNYKQNVDISFDANIRNIKDLNSSLAKYDLKIIEVEKEIDFLVITDTN